ncbi:MAG: hypothetical protein WBL61_19295 [Bryobacteraceae bacterium]
MALEALAGDCAPATGEALESMARSVAGRSQWRDWIIMKLAVMGHRPALDLCIEGVRSGQEFQADQCVLLANLIRLDRGTALDCAVQYFVSSFGSSGPSAGWAENCSGAFASVYSEADAPEGLLELVKRTSRESLSAGERLRSALLRACQALVGVPGSYEPHGRVAIQHVKKQLEAWGRLDV